MKRLIATLVFFDLLCSAQFPKPVASQGWAGAVPGVQSGEYLYCASAVGTDSYACPLVPAIAAYTTGMAVQFKADVANTGACSLSLNGLAAKAIKRGHDVDPADGEIEIGTVVTLVYDGTNWQMQSQTGLGGGAPGGFSNLLNAGYPVTVASAGQATQTAILGSAVGGTGSGFTKFSGPTTAEKTFTLPDASSTVATGAGTTNALSKYTTGASGIIGDSALSDDGVKLFTTAARTFGFGLATRTGNTEPGTTKFVINDMDLAVMNSATLGSPSLADGTFAIPTWTRTGDCTVNTGAAVCTYNTGVGTFTQLNASMTIAMAVSKWYKLVGDVSTTGTAPVCVLTAATADTSGGMSATLRTAAGVTVDLLQFKSAAVPTGFVVSCTSAAAGTVTYDNLVLKEIQKGDGDFYGVVNSRGGTDYGGSGVTTRIIRAGLRQGVIAPLQLLNADGTSGLEARPGGSGLLNTFIGLNAGVGNTTGYDNSAQGANVLSSNTTGIDNSAQGVNALSNNTTGYSNSAQGVNALYSNTTGYSNSAQGVNALSNNTTGSNNSAQGVDAGYTETPANANVTGSQNVWIGYQSGPGVAARLDNSIGVGYRSHPILSNQAVFGNSSITSTILHGLIGLGGTTPTLGLYPTAPGTLEVNSGTAGKWAAQKLGAIALQSLTTPVITSVTPSANNGITCTYVLVARQADNTATTQGSAALGTVAGPTNCNSNTVVWTAAAGVTYYQLNRTVGGATQGMITAMAAWLNNATNCPAGVCTYIDTGTAAAGAVPVANTTGQVVSRSYNTETACASAAGACGTASAGHFSMAAAATTATVSTTAVNANSQIFIQENSTLGALLAVTCNATVVRTYAVSTVTAGVSFVVTASAAPAVDPGCLSFRLLN